MTTPLTHFDETGGSRMVDVSAKAVTARTATAEGFVALRPETLALVLDCGLAKGDALEVARLAGIMGTKRTADLIPLCHPLPIDGVTVAFRPHEPPAGQTATADVAWLRITAAVRTTARTGVEMEALTAVTVAALTLYDMVKAIDRGVTLGPFRLVEKTGGRSGEFRATS